ncbi:phage portal protein [Falsirhodobacter halotolerans]|uniref:phage portal protein n=1 Tax=Falsirhodobacter halotolerans TaxID=1146892 RepID=UPI001FCFD63B|nr:phage portal protein [Falsirhodobacter halotolerans]MCJ8139573.1 phage portal protein [Falsirhodobacter halotolerans]
MKLFDKLRPTPASDATARIEPTVTAQPVGSAVGQVMASGVSSGEFYGFDDPSFKDFMRGGVAGVSEAGISITSKVAMKNTTVLRCVSLISFAIGMLPLHLREKDTKEKAKDHPLFRILHRKPNAWQTAFEFRTLMQMRALVDGDAYALIVRSGSKILQMVPIEGHRVTVEQNPDWSLRYRVDRGSAGRVSYEQRDIFHLRYGLSENGINGISLVKNAADAIGLAIQTDRAAARLFRNGMMVGGVLKHPTKLSPEVYERLTASMEARRGPENAHKDMILEEGMDYSRPTATGKDAQNLEQRKQQVEEIARPFGVPRPLLAVDDTSWGSGIDVLGQLFVRYSLTPWFTAWEQAVERSLLTEDEADKLEAKFNAGGLLRGSMAEQMEFWSKALGAGGHAPIATQEEARDSFDWPVIDREDLPPAPGQQPQRRPE